MKIQKQIGSHPSKFQCKSKLAILLLVIYLVIEGFFQKPQPLVTLESSSSSQSSTLTVHKPLDPDLKASLLQNVIREETINKEMKSSDEEVSDNHSYLNPESSFAHSLLDGLTGIEIAATSHHGFGLRTINIDINSANHQKSQLHLAKVYRRVDVVAPANRLPFANESIDFVLSRHILQQFQDPIGLLCEWGRVVKSGGYIFTVLPKKEYNFIHRHKPSTPLAQLIDRHKHPVPEHQHENNDWTILDEHDALELCWYMGIRVLSSNTKDEGGDGYAFVIKVQRNHGLFSSRCT
jgi:SAM-dependent methyltransferase